MSRRHAAVEFTAQCGEDRWLAANWHRLGLPAVGFFVDVGAADGRTFSNTWWLEKRKGWRGLLVEPDPRHVIADRPRSIVERVAVGLEGTLSLARTRDPFLSSSMRRGDVPGEPRLAIEDRLEVPSVPLSALLEKHGIDHVDLLSIDTEGTELEVWRTLDLRWWRPTIVICEYATWHLRDDLQAVKEAFDADGYAAVETTRYNVIFRDAQP